jgi:hypothetical protein
MESDQLSKLIIGMDVKLNVIKEDVSEIRLDIKDIKHKHEQLELKYERLNVKVNFLAGIFSFITFTIGIIISLLKIFS